MRTEDQRLTEEDEIGNRLRDVVASDLIEDALGTEFKTRLTMALSGAYEHGHARGLRYAADILQLHAPPEQRWVALVLEKIRKEAMG